MYFETNKGLIIMIDGMQTSVLPDHKRFDEIKDLCVDGKYEDAVKAATIMGSIDLVDGIVYNEDTGVLTVEARDKELHTITGRLKTLMLNTHREGGDLTMFVNFTLNLLDNPSASAVSELYNFLVPDGNQALPITSEGTFLAYKAVRNNFTDKHSGKVDNSVGNVVKMKRNLVDDDCRKHCSHGLHAGRYDYASGFGNFSSCGDRMLLVEINPKDVVSVPEDYNGAKLRTCEYLVRGEVKDKDILAARKVFDANEQRKLEEKAVQWADDKKRAEFLKTTIAAMKAEEAEEAEQAE